MGKAVNLGIKSVRVRGVKSLKGIKNGWII